MRRAVIILVVAVFCYSVVVGPSVVVAGPKQKAAPKSAVVAKRRSVWRVLLIPAKYTFAGLLRIRLNSRGLPYE